MKYLLDTDIVINFLKGDINIVKAMTQVSLEDVGISVITRGEIKVGMNFQDKRSKEFKGNEAFLKKVLVVEFNIKSSDIFGKIKANLLKSGRIISDLDIQIASVAIANDLILVTNNTKDFSRIKDLQLINWMSDVFSNCLI